MSNTRWVAVTESGAVYKKVSSGITYEGSEGFSRFRNGRFASVDRSEIPEDEPLEYLGRLSTEASSIPEVGKSIFVVSLKSWKLSTNVVSVEVESDDE